MKRLFLCIHLLALAALHSSAQKPPITDTSYKTWTTVNNGKISGNGWFVSYIINNKPIGQNTVVITATNKSWQYETASFSDSNFSKDSRYLFAVKNQDTLVQLNLQTKEFSFIPHCKGYTLCSISKEDYIIYRLDNPSSDLIIKNLKTQKQRVISNSFEYIINKAGNAIITKLKGDTLFPEVMQWTDLSSGRSKTIYRGKETTNQIFDLTGSKTAFTTSSDNSTQIWVYDNSSLFSQMIASDSSEGIVKGCKISIDNSWKFSSDGEGIFFTQNPVQESDPSPNLTIWSYQDAYLRSYYNNYKAGILSGTNLSLLDIQKKKIRKLLSGLQKVKDGIIPDLHNEYLLVESSFARADDRDWNKYANFSYYLCNVKTGELRIIKEHSSFQINNIILSPDNSYLVYYDSEFSKYISINIHTNKSAIISEDIPGGLHCFFLPDRGVPNVQNGLGGIVGWLIKSKRVLIQGTFDIWSVDLEGRTKPLNLTEGKSNHTIIFSPLNIGKFTPVSEKASILVLGFNLKNKDCGIYNLNLGKKKLEELIVSPTFLGNPYDNYAGFQKAEQSNAYLISEVKVNQSLNYIYTKDFKEIVYLSNNRPEKAYNWINSELLTYKDKDGNLCESILYKPENFDPHKKYPVIFSIYLDQTNSLNNYLSPEPSRTGLNVPLLVSNNYLFVKPNIYRIKGKPGEAALNSVLAAVNYLASYTWVDSSNMAITGHSFGGYEANYIIAKTNKFKAALVGAGPSNLVVSYNELWSDKDDSKQSYLKNAAYLMGEDFENATDKYVENSPIFFARNIKTPVLLLHNKMDITVPVVHSVSLFVQLRKLQKPAWLLQYKDGNHILTNTEDEIDFQDRIKSYFDYFLKSQQMPDWMSNYIRPTHIE
ncbi:prolyl oligopeptidase family serine peptidase [Chitinophaga oryziterrae]|uniref:Prolyl oligopeptidase family serine peptidase n=1 Tax=Chitinophaga oryziterrae TaxID=1031224 RepID=A0A6N8J5Q2_9BACT|nr:prolyl oligopeptidase family serine peptidase [Chitinophaga oryziterrae]MVT40254.1 prolyl oligopeptidase family serine peptidase [Chitinophaga oryziterrae]